MGTPVWSNMEDIILNINNEVCLQYIVNYTELPRALFHPIVENYFHFESISK